MMATVSVIMPTFNRADFVCEAADSVLAQQDADLELVIVDDGSEDDTPRVLQRYAADSRVKVLRQSNSGQSVARNRGLRESRGQFVCFLDSDNRWRPGKLARQLELMTQHENVGVIYGDNEEIDAQGRPKGVINMKRHSGRITEQLLLDNFVTFNTAMTRREYLERVGGLDEAVRVADDYDLWLRLSCECEFLYVPEVWGEYRVMANQISSDKERRFSSNEQILKRFLAAHPEWATPTVQSATWRSFYLRRSRWRASVGRRIDAMADIRRALRYRFFDRRAWRAVVRTLIRPV